MRDLIKYLMLLMQQTSEVSNPLGPIPDDLHVALIEAKHFMWDKVYHEW